MEHTQADTNFPFFSRLSICFRIFALSRTEAFRPSPGQFVFLFLDVVGPAIRGTEFL